MGAQPIPAKKIRKWAGACQLSHADIPFL